MEYKESNVGQKVSGGILVINSLIILAFTIFSIGDKSVVSPIGPAIFDILIGWSILRGSAKWVKLAIVRIILGLLIWGGIAFFQNDIFSAALQIAFSTSLMLLLIGDAKKVRITLACILASFLLIVYLLAIQSHIYGYNTLNTYILEKQYNLDKAKNEIIISKKYHYTFGPLGQNWQLRNEKDARKVNPLSDIWYVSPKYNAHILIIAESVETGGSVDINICKNNAIKNASNLDDYRLIESSDIEVGNLHGISLDTSGKSMGVKFRYKYALFTKKNVAIQIICFSPEETFKFLEADFENAISTFAFEENF
jgi:hypothetical protein